LGLPQPARARPLRLHPPRKRFVVCRGSSESWSLPKNSPTRPMKLIPRQRAVRANSMASPASLRARRPASCDRGGTGSAPGRGSPRLNWTRRFQRPDQTTRLGNVGLFPPFARICGGSPVLVFRPGGFFVPTLAEEFSLSKLFAHPCPTKIHVNN